MERLRRLLRNARIRGDLLAVAVLEGIIAARDCKLTEAEKRLMWGDR
jgi:hypothetical protein